MSVNKRKKNDLDLEFLDEPPTFYRPEERLIMAIIKHGVLEKDVSYFYSQLFDLHCALLRVDPEKLFNMVLARITIE